MRYHQVNNIEIENGFLNILVNGKHIQFELSSISNILGNARGKEVNVYEVSPSGYGIHWPLLDEDISIDGLLGVKHHPEKEQKSTPSKI